MKPVLTPQSDPPCFIPRISRYKPAGFAVLALYLFVGLPYGALSQTDDFNDGDDAGWTRYDRTATSSFSFPGGGYRIDAVYTNAAPLVFSTRSEGYTNFYAAVDLIAWDDNTVTNARSAVGLAFRTADVGFGTTRSLVAYWTPAINGGGNRVFSIFYIWNDIPVAAVAATIVTLETNKTYRMVATGVGDLIEAKLYDLNDLTQPVAALSEHLTGLGLEGFGLPESGKCGLFLFSRNDTTVTATFDNYVAAELDPGQVPSPGTSHPIPGTPQVVNRIPVSSKNFHPPASGVSFTATTLGSNAIAPPDIRMILNGVDVSASLLVTGETNNRSVTYGGLASNLVYNARITLTEVGGKSSTNEFQFDTFSESFITNSTKIVEAEDYNYSGGQYQSDPPPSGFDSSLQLVNGNGVGYVDLQGLADVDFFDQRTVNAGPEANYNVYRFSDRVGTFAGSLYQVRAGGAITETTNDTILQKFATLGLPDYQVHHTEGGEWLNYTRLFAPARYSVYLRSSSFSRQHVLFDEVTSDRTVAGQTTTNLGRFMAVNTGHISTYRYFPLVDDQGNPVSLDWSGEKTFRLTMGGPREDYTRFALQLNYLLFVPVSATPEPFTLIVPNRVGTAFSVSFATQAGFTYTLLHKNSISGSSWNPGATVAGDGSIKTLSDSSSESARFYQVSAQ